ncbi:hypothetical protein ACTMSW_06580 [Micromonospora sp. BQ11]|uniref:hypothetical protein n=1 Tax=Micromonospora sp. BQ11 TaxID=3452212 RepID=UPI003F88CF41
MLVAPSARAEAATPIDSISASAVRSSTAPAELARLREAAASQSVTPFGNCTAGIFCGEVKNRLGRSLKISANWPTNSKTMWLPAGQGSASDSRYYYDFRDTDGFQVPSGYRYFDTVGNRYNAGWHKVYDYQEITLSGWQLL